LTDDELGKVDEMLRGEDPIGTIDQQEETTDVTINDIEEFEEDLKSIEADQEVAVSIDLDSQSIAEQAAKASTYRPMSPGSKASGSYQAVSLLTTQIE